MEYIAIFFTHSGAIRCSKSFENQGIKNSLMPVPRKLSSSCGIGTRFKYDGAIKDIVTEDIEKLYSLVNGDYNLIYEKE